ncbi:DUF2509 family protein [Orbus wheelerorum]|uniref:DUF2509 family protein n=1 Tax=Orbus wheelerorum TaxID=3074111 RepID=UPI00370DAF8D
MSKIRIDSPYLICYRGFSALGMTIILLILGTLLMAEFSRTSLLIQKKTIYQKQYYKAENKALSSIQWAITLQWLPITQYWQCQYLPSQELNACIKKSSLATDNYILIRGQFAQLTRYHLATYSNDEILYINKGHWLDYCPEYRQSNCD